MFWVMSFYSNILWKKYPYLNNPDQKLFLVYKQVIGLAILLIVWFEFSYENIKLFI